jgi:N-carbamoyl-L-amino-acid hydrolase
MSAGSDLARRLFRTLAERTADPPGVTRIAYGAGEQAAHDLVAEAAMAYGAERTVDAAGNLYLVLPGQDRSRVVLIGSHLDSVPHGGDYDGVAGVLLGLALQADLVAEGRKPPCDLAVLCLRAEESCWFPHSYIGSRTALGLLDPGVLDKVRRSDDGLTLAEHIRRLGLDPEGVRKGSRLYEPARIAAFIEPHIEQGPALVDAGMPVGLVTGIRGSVRFREIAIRGEYAHSGATPRALRRDAGLAGARLITSMHAMWDRFEADGRDLTVTFGEIATDPAQHGFSKVPGDLHLCLDMRSADAGVLGRAEAELRDAAGRIAAETGTVIDLGPRTDSAPTELSAGLRACLADAASQVGVPTVTLPSGAGHDAATYAGVGVPTAMLFIRNRNGSHNPDEAMEHADFEAALSVVAAALADPRLLANGRAEAA